MKERGGKRERPKELTSKQTKRTEHTKRQQERPEAQLLFSYAEQGNQRFAVTERERYLLRVMAHIIAEGYFPSLHKCDPESKELIEDVLREEIKRRTIASKQHLKRQPKKY